MGYFSNGTEGEMYEEAWCSRCVHQDIDGAGCPVWNAHLTFNYELCNKKGDPGKVILDALIPREGVHNAQCTMFNEKAAIGDLFGGGNG